MKKWIKNDSKDIAVLILYLVSFFDILFPLYEIFQNERKEKTMFGKCPKAIFLMLSFCGAPVNSIFEHLLQRRFNIKEYYGALRLSVRCQNKKQILTVSSCEVSNNIFQEHDL